MVNPKTEDYSTPLYDKLRPRYQAFLDKYTERMNGRESAVHAGYKGTTDSLSHRASEIINRPEVFKAFKELMAVKRKKLEDSKNAMIERIRIQSEVSLSDLARWEKKERKWTLKTPDEVEEKYHPVLGMVSMTRERDVLFNQGAQESARKQLAQYMLWDKQQRDDNPPVSFNFTGLKRDAYSNSRNKEDES